jgi:hypothetical protein
MRNCRPKIKIFLENQDGDSMRSLFRTLTEIRHLVRRPKQGSLAIRVCPVCHSENLNLLPSFLRFIAPSVYYCEYCGYKGPIFAEIMVDPENKDLTKPNYEQTEEE